MALVKALGGTSDLLPEETRRWQLLETRARQTLELYGYQEIRTPLIEEAAVFARSLGEAAEIVTKQMYLFEDRGGRSVALRPEATASVVRAFIEHGLDKTARMSRFYYLGPMFRAERPQAGRRRQFHQLGVEVFGSASPYQDVEVIALLMRLLESLGLKMKNVMLMLNNLGCLDDRPVMLKKLKEYFLERQSDLCEDCKQRLEVNPLRILDCKNERCRGVAVGSMQWKDWLCHPCQGHFKIVRDTLDQMEIPYAPDPRLVRGLDYYTRTAFEVIYPGLGAQNAVGGGGRYDTLVALLGGAATPAIGFAIGLERVLMAQEADGLTAIDPMEPPQIFIATVSSAQILNGLKLAEQLRANGIAASANLEDRPLKRQIEQAAKANPSGTVLILGEDEVKQGVVMMKSLSTGQQTKEPLSEIVRKIKSGMQ